jgi:hypothetical protein
MITNHNQNFQELWDMIKRQNLTIHSIKEGAEIKPKGI